MSELLIAAIAAAAALVLSALAWGVKKLRDTLDGQDMSSVLKEIGHRVADLVDVLTKEMTEEIRAAMIAAAADGEITSLEWVGIGKLVGDKAKRIAKGWPEVAKYIGGVGSIEAIDKLVDDVVDQVVVGFKADYLKEKRLAAAVSADPKQPPA